jgi:hypothetical protein
VKPVWRGAGRTVCKRNFLRRVAMIGRILAMLMDSGFMGPEVAVFFFLAIGAIALFGFLSVAAWAGNRSAERSAYYKAEMMKKIAEIGGGEKNPALEYLREQERIKAARRMGGFRLGGLINVGIGVALMIFLHAIVPVEGVYLVGLIPLLIGIALAVYGYWLGPQAEI